MTTTPVYCLVAMLLLVILTKIPVAIAMHRSKASGYDNRTPRQQQANLTGWGARALAAHQNTFEALSIFVAAVVASSLGGALSTEAASCAATLAIVHTVARALYPIAYVADIHILRSAIWGVGFGSAVWLALLPVIG